MATKAEWARYLEQRAGPDKPKKRRREDWPARAGLPAHPADERMRHGRTASRNWSLRASLNAPYSLEDSPNGKPSRKSTRRGGNRFKPSHPLRAAKRNLDMLAATLGRAGARRR